MTGPAPIEHLWIIGPGRLGLALGWELHEAGAVTRLTYRGRRPDPPAHPVFSVANASYVHADTFAVEPPDLVLITLPDAAIGAEAASLSRLDRSPSTALHTSGVLGSGALAPLAERGWATGSVHPLVAVPDPIDSAAKLRGAWWGLEGSPEAVRAGGAMVRALRGHPLRLAPEGKAGYHAAAVLASNSVVALLAAAVEVMIRSGVAKADAVAALTSLAGGAVADVAALGAEPALTGPILRGDAGTIELHLARLSPDERALYSVLGRRALAIASERGLAPEAARRIRGILEAGNP